MRLPGMFILCLLGGAFFSLQAAAQNYPVKAVRVIVPTAAGGNPDFILRPVAQKLSESMKQAFVVDNRPGASGIIGVELAARAPADGYTLLFAASGHIATPSALYEKLSFDAMRDFAPISNMVEAPFALFVHPSLPVTSVREFVALAKARPGQISYASFGIGSVPHFLSEAFAARTGVALLHVPYKGSAPASAALLAGHVMSVRCAAIDVAASARQTPARAGNRHRQTLGHGAGGTYVHRSRVCRGLCKRLVWIVRAGGDTARNCREATRRGRQGAGAA